MRCHFAIVGAIVDWHFWKAKSHDRRSLMVDFTRGLESPVTYPLKLLF
jgi:hypothetical protein